MDPRDDLARLAPYLADIRRAAALAGEDPALLAAIMLRETGAGWAPGYVPQGDPNGRGDRGHGRGLMQIDDRGPYRKFLPADGQPWPVLEQLRVACVVLADARAALRPWRREPLYARAWVAAYNAGAPRVADCMREGRDPDSVTTAGPADAHGRRRPDYGYDVWRRRDALMLRAMDLFAPALPPRPVPPLDPVKR